MREIDYTGQTVNGWKILGQDGIHVTPKGVKIKKWKCQCEVCGKISTRMMLNIRHKPPHCSLDSEGHRLNPYRTPKSSGDLVGKRFGLLTVMKRLPTQQQLKHRSIMYQCLCDCGNVCVVPAHVLKKPQTKYPRNCGCIKTLPPEERFKLLSGSEGGTIKKQDRNEVLEMLGQREYPSGQKLRQCKVRCTICGEERIVSTTQAKHEICKHRGRFK